MLSTGSFALTGSTGGVTLPVEIQTEQLTSLKDLQRLLVETINQVRRGDLDPEVANSIGNLSGVLVRALVQGDVEDRLQKIEALISRAQEAQTNGQLA